MTTDTDRDFYSPSEIARRIGISRAKAYQLVAQGEFGPLVTIGGRRFIPATSYAQWVARRSAPSLAVVAPTSTLPMNPRWLAQQKKKAAGRLQA